MVRKLVIVAVLVLKQKRDIVLNLCQYGQGEVWRWGREVGGHSWRTSRDLGADSKEIGNRLYTDVFDVYAKEELHQYAGPGGWNDPDYLLIGQIGRRQGGLMPSPLTSDEQYTHVTFWAIVAAPLIYSGDMTTLDDFTLGLLCNAEVIDVNQDPLGKPGRRISQKGEVEVWVRDLEDGAKAVGLFNRGKQDANATVRWEDLGLGGPQNVRDLWRQRDLGNLDGKFEATVAPHGVAFVRIGKPPIGQLVR